MPSPGALRAGKAIIELAWETKAGTEKAIAGIQARLQGVGRASLQVAKHVAAVGTALTAAAVPAMAAAIKKASDAQETVAKFGQVFGDQAKPAQEFADALAKSIGRSRYEIMQAMSSYQGFFVGLGFGAEESRKMSQTMQALALDFAAFHNISDEDAMSRFISAMSGSSEVLDRFGVNTKKAALEQKLLEMGVKKSWSAVTEQEKSVARLAIIMESMGAQGATGAATREAGSFANQTKALQAAVDDLAISIGEQLLPYATDIVATLKEMFGASKDAADGMGWLGSAVGTVMDVIHTLKVSFDWLKAGIMQLIATAYSNVNKFVSGMLNLLNKIPGVEVSHSQTLEVFAEDFQREADRLTDEFNKALMAKTPSERIGAGQGERGGSGAPLSALPSLAPGSGGTHNRILGVVHAALPQADLKAMQERAKEYYATKQSLEDELQRAQIDAMEDGIDKQKALLDFEKQMKLRALQEQGALNASTQAVVDRIFAAQEGLLRAQDTRTAPQEALFDGRFASQVFGGSGSVEEKQLRELKKIKNAVEDRRGGIPVN